MEQREEGRIEGREEGEKRLTSLISILMKQGDLQNMKKVIADKEYRESLYIQYAI